MDAQEESPPDAKRVAQRALVLSALTARAMLEREKEKWAKDMCLDLLPFLGKAGAEAELEPDEKKFLKVPHGKASDEGCAPYSWQCEGLAVLNWALKLSDLPPYDKSVDPAETSVITGLRKDHGLTLVSKAALRDVKSLQEYNNFILALNWRAVDFRVRPEQMDFVKFARECTWANLNVKPAKFVKNELAVGGKPIFGLTQHEFVEFSGICFERHRASNWLIGGWGELWSEVDTST